MFQKTVSISERYQTPKHAIILLPVTYAAYQCEYKGNLYGQIQNPATNRDKV